MDLTVPGPRQDAAVQDWLQRKVTEDGRTLYAIAKEAGTSRNVLDRILTDPTARTSERMIRRLAAFYGDDADMLAAAAGYADTQQSAPNPREFATIAEWLSATLHGRKETPERAVRGIGINNISVRNIAAGKTTPWRPTLDKIAVYFGVDPAELRAMRPNQDVFVEMGRARAAQLGNEYMADYLRLSKPSIYRLVGQGVLPAYMIGPKGERRFKRSDLDAVLQPRKGSRGEDAHRRTAAAA
jgi:excisionase family DNA binding protein